MTVSVPPSAGDLAVNRLAAQTGTNITVTGGLRNRWSAGLAGRFTAEEAFARLLNPLGARAVRIRRNVYRVEDLPAPPTAGRVMALPVAEPQPVLLDEVIVTAPVARGGVEGLNGRTTIHDTGALSGRDGQTSSEAVAGLSASVESTHQGPGRNKLSVRGVADSALSGPLQATTGQYLGEFRLNFGAPDPDLALTDLRRIEIFEGPQGSRFGAGSIGGVIRLEPERPDPTAPTGRLGVDVAGTPGGDPGAGAAVVLNQPAGPSAAVRLAAYVRRDGGFVDSPVRGGDGQDAVETAGLRLAWRRTSDDWTLDLLGLTQDISANDASTVRDTDRTISDRPFAQPYESRLSLVGAALHQQRDRLRLTTALSVSRQSLDETFDASIPDTTTTVVDRRQTTRAASAETRLEAELGVWTFNGGLSLARVNTDVHRFWRLADTAVGPDRLDLERRVSEAALFGEWVARPIDTVALVLGGRLSGTRIDSRVRTSLSGSLEGEIAPGDAEVAFTPTLGARWTSHSGRTLFLRYDEGRRPGDVAEIRGASRLYRSDRVRLLELGAGAEGPGSLQAEVRAGVLDWRDIQSDVITPGGDLVTDNIGDGRIAFVQVRAAWRPEDTLSLSADVFANRNRLTVDGFGVIGVAVDRIPNVAPVSARLSLDYGPVAVGGLSFGASADLRYVGTSSPGLGAGLDARQGGYVDGDLSAFLDDGRHALVLSVSNPLDTAATRFAIGSPYRLFDSEVVPLRPRTIRLGFETRF